MEFWISTGLSMVLLVSAMGMIAAHLRTWRRVRATPACDSEEQDFYRRQFTRRMQTSLMLGVLAGAIFVGHWIDSPPLDRWMVLLFWGVVLLMVAWLGGLAVADILATRFYFNRLREHCQIEQLKLQLQAKRLQRSRGNGQDSAH